MRRNIVWRFSRHTVYTVAHMQGIIRLPHNNRLTHVYNLSNIYMQKRRVPKQRMICIDVARSSYVELLKMEKKGGMLGFRTSSALQTDKAQWFAIIRGFHVSEHMITHESHTLLTWTQFPIHSLLPWVSLQYAPQFTYVSSATETNVLLLETLHAGTLDDYACIRTVYK